jgi:predicted nucleotidyltransferase
MIFPGQRRSHRSTARATLFDPTLLKARMDLSTVTFSEFDTSQVQELLRGFIDREQEREFTNGAFVIHPKILNDAFIANHFGCDQAKADQLLFELIDGGYLDGSRLAPLPKGMALAHERGLPRLARSEAEEIVRDLVAAAIAANARPGARVLVESLDVFGSYLSDKPTLGDVDVLVVMATPKDILPEDLDERDDVSDMLQVCDHVSLTSELDRIAVEAKKIRIYTRGQ